MMDCSKCDKGCVYNTTVPFEFHENLRAQMSAANARLIRVIVLLIVLLVGSNFAWLAYEHQYETVRIEQENDRGINNYIGNDGDIYKGDSDHNIPAEKEEEGSGS